MERTAYVFVHGVNEHDPLQREMRQWRASLAKAGIDLDRLGHRSYFAYYADWFFASSSSPRQTEAVAAGSKTQADPKVASDVAQAAKDLAATFSRRPLEDNERDILMQMRRSLAPQRESFRQGPAGTREFFLPPGLDITTLIPEGATELFLKLLFNQLKQYFDNEEIVHPTRNEKGKARDIIRKQFCDAVSKARADVGPNGRVIVISHSMGAVVTWDCLQHVLDCESVDGLVTIGSPLALDFVLRGLKRANGNRYRQTIPAKLSGDWHNIVARFDAVAVFDTSLKEEFPPTQGQNIIRHLMDNPDFSIFGRPSDILRSAHSVLGYLRAEDMAEALRRLGETVTPTEADRLLVGPAQAREPRTRVAALAGARFMETAKAREAKAKIVRGPGAEGVAKVEQSERMINKLRLLGHPDQFSRKLVRDAELSIDGRRVLERVLGDRDFVSSSFLLKAAALTTAIGRVSIGGAVGAPQGFGTGFLISPNLLMTNNHVIPSADWAAASHIEFDYGLDSEDQETLPIKVRFRPDVFFVTSHETELDYTVVALNVGDQDLGRPWIQLLQESGKALIKDRVNIIQHPKGRRQEVVVRNNRVTFVDNNKPYAHYEADTEGGSSGSPVFNDHWQLAFLHHASVPEKDSNGLILKKNGEPFRHGDADEDINWISNEGIRISKIVEDLKVARLSSSQERMLKEAFKDPDLTDYVHISRTHDVGPAERSAHLQRTTGTAGQQGPLTRRMTTADGRTSWLFELSFGPAGGESAWSGGQASGRGGYHHPAQTDNVRDGPPPPNVSALFGSSSGPSDADLREAVRTLIENAALEDEYYPEDRDEASKAAYYVDDDLDGGEVALFRRHHDLARINHRNVFSYARARHKVLYPWADRHEDDSLKSIYSGVRLPAEEIMVEELSSMLVRLPQPRESTINPLDYLDFMLDADDAFDVLESGTLPFNCEHVVPQSWFDKRQPMKADLHHLFSCEPGCNSFRSNLPYGEFENYSPEPTPVEEALRDQCGFRETLGGSDAFEPQHGKGAAARATLYFLLRYPGEIGDEGGEFSVERISTLLKWHEDDPVTDYERHRNRAIFLTQGNRNPVIDFPDLAGKIAFRKGIGG